MFLTSELTEARWWGSGAYLSARYGEMVAPNSAQAKFSGALLCSTPPHLCDNHQLRLYARDVASFLIRH
jgi:hypothetical protein